MLTNWIRRLIRRLVIGRAYRVESAAHFAEVVFRFLHTNLMCNWPPTKKGLLQNILAEAEGSVNTPAGLVTFVMILYPNSPYRHRAEIRFSPKCPEEYLEALMSRISYEWGSSPQRVLVYGGETIRTIARPQRKAAQF